MKKILSTLVVLVLGIIIGSTLRALVGKWVAAVILVAILVLVIWSLINRRRSET